MGCEKVLFVPTYCKPCPAVERSVLWCDRKTQAREIVGLLAYFRSYVAVLPIENRRVLPSALSVDAMIAVDARVNGGSNYDSLKVAKCLVV